MLVLKDIEQQDTGPPMIRFVKAAILALALLWSPTHADAREVISKDLAIKFANQQLPGRIVSADTRVEDDGHTFYDLVIQSPDGKLYDVTVDANNGKVIRIHPRDHVPAE